MAFLLNILAWPIVAIVGAKHHLGQRKLISWLNNVREPELVSRLDERLEPLFEGTHSHVENIFKKYSYYGNGPPFWNLESFKRLTTRHDIFFRQGEVVEILWRVFFRAAHYPFPSPESSVSAAKLQIDQFRRAYALLVLHGLDMIGERAGDYGFHQDFYGKSERNANDKAPRISRTLYGFLASAPSTLQNDASTVPANIRDVLYYVQPEVWQHMTIVSKDFMPWFDSAVERLSRPQNVGSEKKSAQGQAMHRTDLRLLLQVLLLLRPGQKPWRQGLQYELKDGFFAQRAGDVYSATLDNSPGASKLASEHASALMDLEFPDEEDIISLEDFLKLCYQDKPPIFPTEWRGNRPTSTLPPFIYSFYLLWSVIFISPQDTSQPNPSSLDTPTTNLLLFMKPALSLTSEVHYRWHTDEHQFQRDLQTSILVFDWSDGDSSRPLSDIFAQKAGDFFHVFLIHSVQNQRFVAFISPSTEAPAHMIQCTDNRVNGSEYIWRTSLLQITPNIKAWNCGGLVATLTEKGALRLTSVGVLGGCGVEVEVNVQNRQVVLEVPEMVDLEEGVEGPAALQPSQQALHMERLQWFRLSKPATRVTHSDWPTMPWTERLV